MNLKAIAEGVETEAQYDFLNNHGCEMILGYLVSRPVSVEQFERLLKRQICFQKRLIRRGWLIYGCVIVFIAHIQYG